MRNNTLHQRTAQGAPTPLEAALAYARRGWRVLPLHGVTDRGACTCLWRDCTSPGKHPRTAHGVKDATTDEAQIRKWWETWPDANIGIACGRESGIVVLDIDPRNGGAKSLQRPREEHGELPSTATCETGGGGTHYYFKYPAGGVRKTVLDDGLDLVSDGGYVVAPPSVHESGERYEWSGLLRSGREPALAPLPDWVRALAAKTPTRPQADDAESERIPEGERHTNLTRIAGRLRQRGWSVEQILDHLTGINERRCDPPLPDREVESIADSAGGWEKGAGQQGSRVQAKTQGQELLFEDSEPWHEPVCGAELLDELAATFRRYLVLPEGADAVLALWVVFAAAFEAFLIAPILAITSPEKQCGKTTLLDILERLVPRPLLASNISPAVVFRAVEKFKTTLLIDEADTFLSGSDELRGVLNSGHRRGGRTLRVVGDSHEPRAFATWSPKAIALIKALPPTLADRSIVISMRRRAPGEPIELLRLDRLEGFEPLRRRAARFALDHIDELSAADPTLPPDFWNRKADNWRPLFAIAECAGGGWPQKTLRAAEALAGNAKEVDTTASIQLLADLRDLFDVHGDRLHTAQILSKLVAMEDRPWADWRHGKPMTANQLSRLLKPFGVRPKDVRIDKQVKKGYKREDCDDTFSRYLPPSEPLQALQSLNGAKKPGSATRYKGSGVAASESHEKPITTGVVAGVAFQEGQAGDDAPWDDEEGASTLATCPGCGGPKPPGWDACGDCQLKRSKAIRDSRAQEPPPGGAA